MSAFGVTAAAHAVLVAVAEAVGIRGFVADLARLRPTVGLVCHEFLLTLRSMLPFYWAARCDAAAQRCRPDKSAKNKKAQRLKSTNAMSNGSLKYRLRSAPHTASQIDCSLFAARQSVNTPKAQTEAQSTAMATRTRRSVRDTSSAQCPPRVSHSQSHLATRCSSKVTIVSAAALANFRRAA
jgi:hypothetical protein